MERSLNDVENPQPGADHDALVERFNESKAEHQRSVEALERAEALAEAQRNLKVEPVADEPESEAGGVEFTRSAGVTNSPLTYERGGEHSFILDIKAAKRGNRAAQDRLEAHQGEMLRYSPEMRAISQTIEHGGDFIPPVWLQEQWIKLPRAGRPAINTFNRQPWIPQTNSINIPKVKAGVTVAAQTDGNAVSSTDIETSHVTVAIQTVAGQQDVSQQLVDLSLPGIDLVIFDDLVRALDTKLDVLGLTGTVTNAKGLKEVSGINTRTFTSASPKVGELYPKLAGAIADVHTNIFESPDVILMHPLRWAWILSAKDTQERPLIVPSGQPGFNAMGLYDRVAAENVVGNMLGLPVVVDASLPTNEGSGTNQDSIYVYKRDHIFWYEQVPVLRVFEEVLSNTLQVRFQLYTYYGITGERLPKAITKIEGTGLTAPTF